MTVFSATDLLARHGIAYVATKSGKFTTTCPHCRTGYLNVKVEQDKVVWYCHHCDEGAAEHFEPREPSGGDLGKPAAIYDYCDENGKPLFQVLRFEPPGQPKQFRQRTGPDQTKWSIRGVRIVPYRLPELLEAIASDHIVFIVEGEKKVEALRARGIPATCNPMGAGKWRDGFNEIFRDANVVISGDNDQPGRDHVRKIANSLHGIAARLRVLDLANVWPKIEVSEDIADWLESHDAERLWQIVGDLPDWQPAPEGNGQGTELWTDAPAIILSYTDIAIDPIPPREWLVLDRIPSRTVALLSGEGAVGKSILLLQLSVAVTLGSDWIGTLPISGPVIYLNCEDDDAEICRRLEAVATHYGVTRKQLSADLHVLSLVGRDAVLGFADKNNRMQPTPLFEQVRVDALKIKPALIVIDTVADVFPGRENDRSETRQFISLMRGLALDADAAVVLVSHPSLAGISTDTGLSGNTAWHNSVRARAYFKDASEVDDPTLRILEWRKNNYGPLSEKIFLRWRAGVYVPEPRAGSFEQMAEDAKVENLFLDLLHRFTKQGRNVTDKKGTSYAPALFADEPEAKAAKATNRMLAEAMRRLFLSGKISIVNEGPASKRRSRMVET
jgi:RecA-family ATPase